MLTCEPNGCKRNGKNEKKFVRRAQNSVMRYCKIVTKLISLFANPLLPFGVTNIINFEVYQISKLTKEGEVTDVCYAIEVLKKEAVAEELINSVKNVMNKFQVSLVEACETLNHTVEQYNQAKELLEKAKKEAENTD